LFDPWIRDPDHISESVNFLGLKILKFFHADPIRNLLDPGSGKDEKLESEIGIKIPDPQH
jgi:hypothetical protein